MRFLIKWPTRSRPAQFVRNLRDWILKLSGRHHVLFLVNQDTDDPKRFEVYRALVAEYGCRIFPPYIRARDYATVEFIEGSPRTKIQAVNWGLEGRVFDIILNAADDMWPLVAGYDDVIARAMDEHFPGLDGALNFWDGDTRRRDYHLCTLSIMGRRLFDFFGYIYNPEYVSLYADQEFTEVCEKIGRMIDVPGYRRGEHCLIQHRHPITLPGGARNYDPLMKRNEHPALYARDEATYKRRKARNFDLPGTGAELS
jgi:hypothetical protein